MTFKSRRAPQKARAETIARNCFAFRDLMTPDIEAIAGRIMLAHARAEGYYPALPPVNAKEARLIRDKYPCNPPRNMGQGEALQRTREINR
jgi:hypothetical protein